jgi:hypothetical protein
MMFLYFFSLTFRYQKDQHNAVQVKQSGYGNCTMDNAFGNWSNNNDLFFLNESKCYYYIDNRGKYYSDMKVAWVVACS